MTKSRLEEILDEYKSQREEIIKDRPGSSHKKGAPLNSWRAIDLLFQAIEDINNRLKRTSTGTIKSE